jgi:hypothetical protein
MWRPPDPLDAVVVWPDQAEHAAESLIKGSRIVVLGKLQQRSWTAEDGSARSTVEESGPIASSTKDATVRDVGEACSRSAPSSRATITLVRSFFTNSRPASGRHPPPGCQRSDHEPFLHCPHSRSTAATSMGTLYANLTLFRRKLPRSRVIRISQM